MLMAAGLGTRLKPFTDLEPKALLPMMGVPMAQFALDAAIAAGVGAVVANVHHHADRMRAGLQALERDDVELKISDESAELLGSAGGLRHALQQFEPGAPFFLLNADVLCDVDLAKLARAHARLRRAHGVTLTLTVFSKPPLDPGQTQKEAYREIVFDPVTGLIQSLGTKVMGKPYFVGAAVIEPEALRGTPPSGPAEFVPTVLEPAVRAGRAGVYFTQGRWYDVGSPALWLQAHLALLRSLETGRVPRAWRLRIERTAKRVAPELWVARGAGMLAAQRARWVGPAYWDDWGDSTALAPRELGPGAVLYGAAQSQELSEGIGFRGLWTAADSSSRPG